MLASSMTIRFEDFNIPLFGGKLPPAPEVAVNAPEKDQHPALVKWLKQFKLENSLYVVDTSTSGWKSDSKSKVDVSVIFGRTNATSANTVLPIEFKGNLDTTNRKKGISQIVDRFRKIFMNQPERKFAVGVLLSRSQIEFVSM